VPETALAREAGLEVGRGVLVDDRLRTSCPGVFAAGDASEHAGRVYGIIPAAFEQARIAAHNMLGLDMPYAGTVPANTLKVAGLHVTSVGEVHAAGPGFESLVRSDPGWGSTRRSSSGRAAWSARSGWAPRRGPRRSAASRP